MWLIKRCMTLQVVAVSLMMRPASRPAHHQVSVWLSATAAAISTTTVLCCTVQSLYCTAIFLSFYINHQSPVLA